MAEIIKLMQKKSQAIKKKVVVKEKEYLVLSNSIPKYSMT